MCNGISHSTSDSTRLRGLKQILSQKQINQAIGEKIKTRYCKRINNQKLIWLIVGLGLFGGKSYRQIFRLCSQASDIVPIRATLTNARKRLAPKLLEQLANTLVKLLANRPSQHPFAYYNGLRLMGIDGTLLDTPDTPSNRQTFGRSSNQISHGAFPKVRVLCLCELGTRVLWRTIIGTFHQSEQKLVLPLLEHLDHRMLLLADRHFGIAPIVYRLLGRHVPFLIRVKKSQLFPVEKRLDDGSFISTIYQHKNDRRRQRPGKKVRVIRYRHSDSNRPGCGELHVLITSLMDAQKSPARELVELYHVRWEEEIAFSEWKVVMCQGKPLRSQSPQMIRQEIWGMLIGHFILRKLIFLSSQKAAVAPIRISFTGALNILHARLPEARQSRRLNKRWFEDLLGEIGREQLPARVDRINPRRIKKRSKSWPTKHDHDRSPPKSTAPFAKQIEISI